MVTTMAFTLAELEQLAIFAGYKAVEYTGAATLLAEADDPVYRIVPNRRVEIDANPVPGLPLMFGFWHPETSWNQERELREKAFEKFPFPQIRLSNFLQILEDINFRRIQEKFPSPADVNALNDHQNHLPTRVISSFHANISYELGDYASAILKVLRT